MWPTEPLDNAFADGQAQAGPRIFLFVESLEKAEDALGIMRLEPDPVIRTLTINSGRRVWRPT
jgi:hypothetical protein